MHTRTHHMLTAQAQSARRFAGFTLMETLVALGLFTLGFVAIAALLPAGALLQRETADDIQSRHLERNAIAIIASTPIDEPALLAAYHPGGVDAGLTHLKSFDELTGTDLNSFWALADRSFAASITDLESRTFFWLPLIRDADIADTVQDWQIVVFVLRRHDNVDYQDREYPAIIPAGDPAPLPGLARVNIDSFIDDKFTLVSAIDHMRPNDVIVDSQGRDYRIVSINSAGNEITVDSIIDTVNPPNAIWYAPAPVTDSAIAGRSPAIRVFSITSDQLDLRN